MLYAGPSCNTTLTAVHSTVVKTSTYIILQLVVLHDLWNGTSANDLSHFEVPFSCLKPF